MLLITSSVSLLKVFNKVTFGVLLPISTALSDNSFRPFPLRAEVSNTSHPSDLESFEVFIMSPFLFTTSIIFKAITTGIPSSTS